MCGSMVDIQSPAAEIMRGKKDRKIDRKIVTTGQKYNGPPGLFHRAAITNRIKSALQVRFLLASSAPSV